MPDELDTSDPVFDPDEPTPAEPDEGDEPAAGDETVADDEPAAGDEVDDEQSSLALVRALDREATRHERALAKALGVPVEAMHSCPTCEGMGYTPEAIEAEPEIPQDPFLRRCERCNGTARVRTGATSLGLETIPCPVCGEKGYEQLAEQPDAGAATDNGPAAHVPTYPPPSTSPDVPAEVLALRQQGYTVIDPIVVPEPAPA